MTEKSGNVLKFEPFESAVEPSFWHQLSDYKLDRDRLQESERVVSGLFLQPGSNVLLVSAESFKHDQGYVGSVKLRASLKDLCEGRKLGSTFLMEMAGYIVNLNSLKAFSEKDKNQMIQEYGSRVQSSIVSGTCLDQPTCLNLFFILAFSDLKKFEYTYWFGFPSNSGLTVQELTPAQPLSQVLSQSEIDKLLSSHGDLDSSQQSVFGVTGSRQCVTLKSLTQRVLAGEEESSMVAFLDPGTRPFLPGWPLRNILAALQHHCPGRCKTGVKVVCLRPGVAFSSSFVLHVTVEGREEGPVWTGWQRNARGKFGPRSVSLRDQMDPQRIAATAAHLNLRLMKWRLAPDLDLDKVASLRCLLLGAGTLGCNVARCLLGWGVKKITLVDSGTVSYSNPVRQSLFTLEDCREGRPKALAAAQALGRILPTVDTSGSQVLEIPMPGHPTSSLDQANALHTLLQSHDVVFLLTDSRESRWLPTLQAASLGKLAITAALGFDSYLVIRHGVEAPNSSDKLGCYFCNDVTSPGNSTVDRTLDQQCTVTRPGASYVAAALAVELAVALSQAPGGWASSPSDQGVLGAVPHSLRGFLSDHQLITPATPAFAHCVACSPPVIAEYAADRPAFLARVFHDHAYLEHLSGITALMQQANLQEVLELSDHDSD